MKIFDSRSSMSSIRVNMFIITLPTAVVILALAFYIFWYSYHFHEPEWAGISLFIAAVAGFLFQLWYGKERNKKVEVSAGEISAAPNEKV